MLYWYGDRCPSFQEMEEVAHSFGVQIAFHDDFDVPRFFWDHHGRPWFIGIPKQFGNLARCWAIAHELGHLIHHGAAPRDSEQHDIQEEEADRWASCAMIPDAVADEQGGIPSVHQLVAYLRANFQAFEYKKEDRVRALAYRIAYTRLRAFKEEVA